ncbi:hypothetical protein EIP91_000787 [Steccherinum ochraceum]|uniref:DUF6593 domain-containing protein n=1 Tax=Steccherinum ochraceum TaxID=92696 RepID=A0A4V2MWN0_9APHY|nr:hypothetical protein EIP91_000787 [Steccherinum ochraceum]
MELHLSRDNTTHTVLLAASGDSASFSDATPLYHIYTPTPLLARETTTVSRINRSGADALSYKLSTHSSNIRSSAEYNGAVEPFASINWRKSRVTCNSEELKIRRGGFLWIDRTFLGQDGLSYTWHKGMQLTLSVAQNGGKIELARYHDSFFTMKKPWLEILPEGMHMLDLIVTSWVVAATRKSSGRGNGAVASATAGASAAGVISS